jgi:hypothetical protein
MFSTRIRRATSLVVCGISVEMCPQEEEVFDRHCRVTSSLQQSNTLSIVARKDVIPDQNDASDAEVVQERLWTTQVPQQSVPHTKDVWHD